MCLAPETREEMRTLRAFYSMSDREFEFNNTLERLTALIAVRAKSMGISPCLNCLRPLIAGEQP